MEVRFLGQSGFQINMGNSVLVIDPFICGNPLAKNLDVDQIEADYILLTHGHQDHVADAEHIAKSKVASIVSNYEIVNWYGEKGIKGHPMNHGGKWVFDFGTVKYVNAIHSSVMPDGTYGGNAGGFVLWNDDISFYIAGDTALSQDMKLIPLTCPKLDFAILPIGDNFTMGIEDAIIAAGFVKCNRIIGCHYNTFGYIEIDTEEAVAKFGKAGIELILLQVGESIDM